MDSFCKSMDSFRIVVTNPDSKKIRFVSYHESWLHRFANPDSWVRFFKIRIVDSFHDAIFKRFVSWIRFVDSFLKDSFREKKISKLLDSFRFGRIRIRIPHPYKLSKRFQKKRQDVVQKIFFFKTKTILKRSLKMKTILG